MKICNKCGKELPNNRRVRLNTYGYGRVLAYEAKSFDLCFECADEVEKLILGEGKNNED